MCISNVDKCTIYKHCGVHLRCISNIYLNVLLKCAFEMFIVLYKIFSKCTIKMYSQCTTDPHSWVLLKCILNVLVKVPLKCTFEMLIFIYKMFSKCAPQMYFKCTI